MKKRLVFLSLSVLLPVVSMAQLLQPAKWSYRTSDQEVRVGQTVDLIFQAQLDPTWYIYSSDMAADIGPLPAVFTFTEHPSYELVGDIKPQKVKEKYDEVWGANVRILEAPTARFVQTVRILSADPQLQADYEYQTCTTVDGRCIPGSGTARFTGLTVLPAPAAAAEPAPTEPTSAQQPPQQAQPAEPATAQTKDTVAADSADSIATGAGSLSAPAVAAADEEATAVQAPEEEEAGPSFWALALFTFGAGFLALLTPCVYPMIPMTISYFTKGGQAKGSWKKALFYGLSIIGIYTVLGTLVSYIFGASFAYELATHWFPNLFFFALFVVFALAFLGMFELVLPSAMVNKVDRQADRGGYVGLFFMALALVVVGFSCTAPVAGAALFVASQGQVLEGAVRMFFFSLPFALVFTTLGLFPSLLKSLPKSGGWLNSLKVVLGFVELALAFKFLSQADLAYHWGLLNRDVFLAIMIAIALMLGLYLLGKLRLPNDSPIEKLPVPRLLLAIGVFSFALYLVPGLWGAPLRPLSGYLPPLGTQQFRPANQTVGGQGQEAALSIYDGCLEPMYTDFLHSLEVNGVRGYYDLLQAQECAEVQNKPIFIDFTGHSCVNCREMEAKVWSDPRVRERLNQDYVVVALYVDEKTKVSEDRIPVSLDAEQITTIGGLNLQYQIQKFEANAQPYYVLMDLFGETLVEPRGYDLSVQGFIDFLDAGKAEFERRQQQ